MTDQPTCPSCFKPQGDGLVCATCTGWLTRDIRQLPELHRQLRITYTRQSQAGTGNGGKGAETAVPFDGRASAAAEAMVVVIGRIIRRLDHGDLWHWVTTCLCITPQLPCDLPRHKVYLAANMTAWSTWLLERVQRIRGHRDAADIIAQIQQTVRDARRVIDRPADKMYIGKCDLCRTDLYATKEGETVACRACAEVAGEDGYVPFYDAADRRAQNRITVYESLATLPEIIDGVPETYGVKLNAKTVRSWRDRGKLTVRGTWAGRDVFRVGDVVELARKAAPAPEHRAS